MPCEPWDGSIQSFPLCVVQGVLYANPSSLLPLGTQAAVDTWDLPRPYVCWGLLLFKGTFASRAQAPLAGVEREEAAGAGALV